MEVLLRVIRSRRNISDHLLVQSENVSLSCLMRLINLVVHVSVYLNCHADFSPGGSVNLVGEPPSLPPLTMATKAESVASVTSQCSFSSTIVHVGDKKPPESGGHRQHSHSLQVLDGKLPRSMKFYFCF